MITAMQRSLLTISFGLAFRHADGNQWYLSRPQSNRSTGWTTWKGQRYQLSCWR